ncbi:MAG: hypothetical protein ACFE8N_04045 [Promethearchaeota archaeon]
MSKEDQFITGLSEPIIDTLDELHILKAKVGSIIPVAFLDNKGNMSILVQSIGSFELDGIKSGYGTFETLRKVF